MNVGSKVYFHTVAQGAVTCRIADISDGKLTLFVTARKHPTYKYGETFSTSSNWVSAR